MSVGTIITSAMYGAAALLMMGIGISQLRSDKPVGFYSGERPPREEELTDVGAWNQKHGLMWLGYGIIMIASFLIRYMIGDSVWATVPLLIGSIVPVFFMIWYHQHLKEKYRKKENK